MLAYAARSLGLIEAGPVSRLGAILAIFSSARKVITRE